MQGVIRNGRSMILRVLLDAHAAGKRLETPNISLFRSLSRGLKGANAFSFPSSSAGFLVNSLGGLFVSRPLGSHPEFPGIKPLDLLACSEFSSPD